jgi:mono/diheme cytochrome c family protein
MESTMIRLAALCLVVISSATADACNRCGIFGAGCHVAAVKQVYAAPVVKQLQAVQYVPQHVYYFVGAPLRAEAVIEHAKQRDPDYQQFQEFKRFLEFQTQAQNQQAAEQPERSAGSMFSAKCLSCHNATKSAGGINLDGPLSAEIKVQAMESALDGRMPKGRPPLSSEELGELIDELFLER